MMNPDVATHLEKYFKLSRTYFKEGDYALAAFFAITTIEETAKVLISHSTSREWSFREIHNHREKYLSALINLITQNPEYEKLPDRWGEEVESWWDTKKLMQLRNDALYINIGKNEEMRTPAAVISAKQAALLVYIAGVALAELDEYISGLPSGWKKSVLEISDTFRQQYLKE